MKGQNITSELNGPTAYRNWLAFNKGLEPVSISEFPMYTDANIIGEITNNYGPYIFLNTVPGNEAPGKLQPSIVLRVVNYLDNNVPQMKETDLSNYHGGWLTDEIAALMSLCMGIRVKSGDESRRFDVNEDPLGRPQANRLRSEPILSVADRRLKILNAVGEHSLEKLSPLKILPKLSKIEAITLIRAARLYSDALWISESEPALSWVMFVSALETCANVWSMREDTPTSKLKESKPELYKILEDTDIQGLTDQVSNQICHLFGATNKFIKFVLQYLPEPPENRPRTYAQISWSKRSMKKALSKIYDYRSKALHVGIPFPAPMCNAGMVSDNCMTEKPFGLASHSLGGTWVAKDTPMLLHMFEHITRGALLNWLGGFNKK